MTELHLDLQDGFDGDTVSVEAGGKELARRENVRTRRMLGLAISMIVAIPDNTKKIKISIPAKGLTRELEIPAGNRTYVGASVANGDVEAFVSADPFNYA